MRPLVAGTVLAILALGGAVVAARRVFMPARAPVAQTGGIPAQGTASKAASGAVEAAREAGVAVQDAAQLAGGVAAGAAKAVKQVVASAAGAGDAAAGPAPKPEAVKDTPPRSWKARDMTLEEIKTLIAKADISETDRLQLMAAFRNAQGDPVALQSVLDKLKLSLLAAKKK